jgi:hypothetical protein
MVRISGPGSAYIVDTSALTVETTQCSDGIDNDGDGSTDYPNDPGCRSVADDAESPNPQCSDGTDNDADGWTDYPDDAACASLSDDNEGPACPPVVPQVVACLSPGSLVNSFSAYSEEAQDGPSHHVAGYVDTYRFLLPGGASVNLPCVGWVTDGVMLNPCAAVGGTFVSRVQTLVDQTQAEPLRTQAVTIRVCRAELALTVLGFGVTSAPVYSVC